jgi:hypothetical protein
MVGSSDSAALAITISLVDEGGSSSVEQRPPGSVAPGEVWQYGNAIARLEQMHGQRLCIARISSS